MRTVFRIARRVFGSLRTREEIQDFTASINEWALQGEEDENRIEAMRKIIEVFTRNNTELNLSGLSLRSLPEKIWHLTSLEVLDLANNRLTSLSEEVVNLNSITRLNLYNNSLTTFPMAIFGSFGNQNLGVTIDIESNNFSMSMIRNLRARSRNTGVNFFISANELPRQNGGQSMRIIEVLNSIINKAKSEDQKENIRNFLGKEELAVFKKFLIECCTRTEGKNVKKDEMIEALFEIVAKMQESNVVKGKCISLAEIAFGDCGDRVALTFAYMQLPQNLSDREVKDFNKKELKNYAKDNFIIKFLNDKAEVKINEMRAQGEEPDEIENYLAYLQISDKLGLNLKAIQMLYQANVTEHDLNIAEAEFRSLNLNKKIAEYIYDDASIKAQHPDIKLIITAIANKDEFSSDFIEGESGQEYKERLGKLQESVKKLTVTKIENYLAGKFVVIAEPESDSEEEEVSPNTKVANPAVFNIGELRQSEVAL